MRIEQDEHKKIFSDKVNDNVNLQFKVKELKSLLDSKTELLESLNIKGIIEKTNFFQLSAVVVSRLIFIRYYLISGDKFDKQTLNDYHVKYRSLIRNLKLILRNQQCYPGKKESVKFTTRRRGKKGK